MWTCLVTRCENCEQEASKACDKYGNLGLTPGKACDKYGNSGLTHGKACDKYGNSGLTH